MSTPVCKVWDAEQGEYVGIPVLKGKKGDQGAAGKSAYQYAQDGGYTGTKLGVIENGSY